MEKLTSEQIDKVLNTRAQCERIVRYAMHQYEATSAVLAQIKYGQSDWTDYGTTCAAWIVDDMARAVIKDGAYYFSIDLFNKNGFKFRADFTLKMACPFKGYIHENGAGELVVSGKIVK